jgi:hypothetical protein
MGSAARAASGDRIPYSLRLTPALLVLVLVIVHAGYGGAAPPGHPPRVASEGYQVRSSASRLLYVCRIGPFAARESAANDHTGPTHHSSIISTHSEAHQVRSSASRLLYVCRTRTFGAHHLCACAPGHWLRESSCHWPSTLRTRRHHEHPCLTLPGRPLSLCMAFPGLCPLDCWSPHFC